jgi:uncharacterized protein (TIGR03435 family)
MPVRRTLLLLALAVPIAHPQAPPAATAPLPQFDVISVKPNKTTPGGAYGLVTTQFTADGFRGANVPVHTLIQQAYGLREGQVVDEPAWVKTEVFDIEAKVAGPDIAAFTKLNFDQRQAMFQQILTERFKLVAHRETRELPVYALSVAKGGPKFKESPPDPNMIPGAKGPGNFGMGMGRISAHGTAIPYFASMLSPTRPCHRRPHRPHWQLRLHPPLDPRRRPTPTAQWRPRSVAAARYFHRHSGTTWPQARVRQSPHRRPRH